MIDDGDSVQFVTYRCSLLTITIVVINNSNVGRGKGTNLYMIWSLEVEQGCVCVNGRIGLDHLMPMHAFDSTNHSLFIDGGRKER